MDPIDTPNEQVARLEATVSQLLQAVESRDIIGQAKGILMERHGIDAEEAFARLVRMSQASNVRLREVAEYLVELRADRLGADLVDGSDADLATD